MNYLVEYTCGGILCNYKRQSVNNIRRNQMNLVLDYGQDQQRMLLRG
jgi:hypothetical protein